jgi:hypothetical protein
VSTEREGIAGRLDDVDDVAMPAAIMRHRRGRDQTEGTASEVAARAGW